MGENIGDSILFQEKESLQPKETQDLLVRIENNRNQALNKLIQITPEKIKEAYDETEDMEQLFDRVNNLLMAKGLNAPLGEMGNMYLYKREGEPGVKGNITINFAKDDQTPWEKIASGLENSGYQVSEDENYHAVSKNARMFRITSPSNDIRTFLMYLISEKTGSVRLVITGVNLSSFQNHEELGRVFFGKTYGQLSEHIRKNLLERALGNKMLDIAPAINTLLADPEILTKLKTDEENTVLAFQSRQQNGITMEELIDSPNQLILRLAALFSHYYSEIGDNEKKTWLEKQGNLIKEKYLETTPRMVLSGCVSLSDTFKEKYIPSGKATNIFGCLIDPKLGEELSSGNTYYHYTPDIAMASTYYISDVDDPESLVEGDGAMSFADAKLYWAAKEILGAKGGSRYMEGRVKGMVVGMEHVADVYVTSERAKKMLEKFFPAEKIKEAKQRQTW